MLVVLFAAGGLIWLLSRRTEHVGSIQLGETTPEPAEAPTPASGTRYRVDAAQPNTVSLHTHTTSNLDDLIADRVPFQEEPVSLPTGLEMFGKPTTTVRYRLDDADEAKSDRGPRRPHIVRQLARAAAQEQAATADDEIAPKKTEDVRSSIDGRSARLLDRALTAVHGARQS